MVPGRSRRVMVTSLEVLVYVLLAALAAVVVGSGLSGTVNSWRAQHEGEDGTFTPVEQHCHQVRRATLCDWTGTWESDIGDRRVEGVLLDEDLGTAEGDPPPGPVRPVLYHDAYSDPQVVYRPGDRTWLVAPALTVVLIGGFGYLAWRMRSWSRRAVGGVGRRAVPRSAVGDPQTSALTGGRSHPRDGDVRRVGEASVVRVGQAATVRPCRGSRGGAVVLSSRWRWAVQL
jgi:hypothetical protein